MIKKKSKKPLLVACDVYRPAAIEQLKVIGEQIGVEVYSDEEEKNPVKIAKDSIKFAKKNEKNLVIIDTAGRLAIDEKMMNEIKSEFTGKVSAINIEDGQPVELDQSLIVID